MSNTKITVPFVDCGSNIPIIRVKVGDMWTNAIIDTGAESTLVSADMLGIPEAKITEEDLIANFTGVGDYKGKKIVRLDVDAKIKNRKFVISGYDFDLSAIIEHFDKYCGYKDKISFVLGSDFLNRHDTVVDYEERLVTLTV